MSVKSLWLALVAAVAIATAFGVANVRLREAHMRSQRDLDAAQVVVRKTRSVAASLLATLKSYPLPEPLLVGTDLTGLHQSVVAQGRPIVIYVIDPRCAGCATNLPQLNSLFQEHPGQVVGFGDGDVDELKEYAVTHQITFPVILPESGTVAHLLPRHVTPVLVGIAHGKLELMLTGRLDTLAWLTVRRSLASQ